MGAHVRIDMVGKVFGQWTVLSPSHQSPSRNWYWNCVCSCGNERSVEGSKLRRGKTTKCHKCSGRSNGRKGLYSKSEGDPVYFIKCGHYVKIGSSKDIERRFKDLESSNPYPLFLLDTDEDEEFWHDVFKHKHHRGEWYFFKPHLYTKLAFNQEYSSGACEI